MRLPRVFRSIVWPLTALSVALVAAWLLLLSPPVLTRLAEHALARATGVPVQVRNARWDGWGQLSAEEVVITAPGWQAPSDRLLELHEFRSKFRPLDLLIGRITIEDLELRDATLRLSQQDLPDGTHRFNLSSLAPTTGGFGPSVSLRPTHVRIGLLRVENRASSPGLDGAGRPTERASLVTRGFRAVMDRKPDAGPHDLAFALVEVEEPDLASTAMARDRADGLRIDGEWNDVSFAYEVRIPTIDFGRSIRPLLPLVYGETWDRLGVKGTVSDLRIRGDPRVPVREAGFDLRDAAINLADFGFREDWYRFREGRIEEAAGLPRMAVDRGSVLLRDNRLTLKDFAGRLLSVAPTNPTGPFQQEPPQQSVPLPATLTVGLDFRQTPPPASLEEAQTWFMQAVDHAGFDLKASVPAFVLQPTREGKAWVVELPRVVVNILDNFRVRQGSIPIAAEASRPPSPVGSPPPSTLVKGSLRITEGAGAYVNFPYPLTGVDANIEFEDDQVHVRELKARGSEGCELLITGSVDGTGDDAGVDLQVRTRTEAPIDQPLQDAFQPGPRRIFELLFARAMRVQLVQAGLLPAEGTELGGRCLFDVRVRRKRGGGDHVETTGTIQVRDARVLCTRFPYPIDVQTGLIELEDERIVLPADRWRFTTAGGGSGRIAGEVRIPRAGGGREAFPDLRVDVEHDRINPLLLAALPLDSWKADGAATEGWPGTRQSEIAQTMRALGMTGLVAVGGTIGSDAEGSTTLDLDVRLREGAFSPRNGPDRLLETSGLPWPEGFDMAEVSAWARVTERRAWLHRLEGRAGTGHVVAEGAADLRRRDRWLRAKLEEVPLGTWLPRMLPEAFESTATEAWERCGVRGFFDADILLSQPAEGPETRRAILATPGIEFVTGGQPFRIDLRCGHLVIEGPTLDLIDVEIEALRAGTRVASIQGNGSIAVGPGGEQDLVADWRVDSLASPLLPTVLQAGNLTSLAEVVETWNPAGSMSGRVRLGRRDERPARPDWSVEVDGPIDVTGDPGGVPMVLRMPEGAWVRAGPDRIGIGSIDTHEPHPLEARVPGGQFGVAGELSLGPEAERVQDMSLWFDLAPLHPSVAGVLPAGLARGLRGIDLVASSASSADMRLLGWAPDAPAIGLRGRVRLDDGSMDAGIRLEGIDADFDVDARSSMQPPMRIRLGGGEGSFLVRGRLLQGVDGRLTVGEGGGPIHIDGLGGTLYGGRVTCDADVDAAEDTWWVRLAFDGSELAGLVRGGDARASLGATGSVRGSIALEGGFGSARPVSGIGHVQATAARMGELPLTLRMLQASQLMLPLADSLDTADVRFHLRGPDLRFDRFDLTCPTLRLLGSGSLDLQTWNVAMRFRNRGTVPLLSDLFGAASDQLFVIDVSGPASDPKAQVTPLPPLGEDPSRETPRPAEVATEGAS